MDNKDLASLVQQLTTMLNNCQHMLQQSQAQLEAERHKTDMLNRQLETIKKSSNSGTYTPTATHYFATKDDVYNVVTLLVNGNVSLDTYRNVIYYDNPEDYPDDYESQLSARHPRMSHDYSEDDPDHYPDIKF